MTNTSKLIQLMKMGSINIPMYLIRNYKELGIDAESVLFLAYLINKDLTVDYTKIEGDMNIDRKTVLGYINNLQESGLLNIKVEKNESGLMEEIFSLEPLYVKLSLSIISEEEENFDTGSNIYKLFEEEFGRTLSPMEYEIITGWLNSKYNEEVIIEALKEAVYNGANSLRYIDKILFEWNKKGIKSKGDIAKDKESYAKQKKEKIEIPDYNWLEEDE